MDIPRNEKPLDESSTAGTEELCAYKNEIDIAQYFRVLLKYKCLILIGTIIPVLVAGIIMFFVPETYRTVYVYDVKDVEPDSLFNWNLDERNYNVMLERFYSAVNTEKILNELRKSNLVRYSTQISKMKNKRPLEKIVRFNVEPSYINFSKQNAATAETLNKFRELEAHLLNMTIEGDTKKDTIYIAHIIRHNFENVIVLYTVKDWFDTEIRKYKRQISNGKKNWFGSTPDGSEKSLLSLTKEIITELGGFISRGDTIQQFKSYLRELVGSTKTESSDLSPNWYTGEKVLFDISEDKESNSFLCWDTNDDKLPDSTQYKRSDLFLSWYIRELANKMSITTPVTESPKVYYVPKNAVKIIALVFTMFLTISVFTAFLLEEMRDRPQES